MSENQKLREALQAIRHIDDTTNHTADASAALDRIGSIVRQALALPTADENLYLDGVNVEHNNAQREPDWSNSKTSPMEIWKNRVNTLADRLEMADGAISFRDEVIANLREQLAEARSDQKPMAAQPCRSPYCECELGKCSHPGFYDARHMPCEGST